MCVENDMTRLADQGLRVRKLRSAHEDLEKYLLDCDPATVACEVPVWFGAVETRRSLPGGFDWDAGLTGHIDVLRCESDGRIGVWDYKPSAASEVRAHAQVFLYALMLSTRTGLPLEMLRCGYFDAAVAFSFLAADVRWVPTGGL
jgi:hypothetical protein